MMLAYYWRIDSYILKSKSFKVLCTNSRKRIDVFVVAVGLKHVMYSES